MSNPILDYKWDELDPEARSLHTHVLWGGVASEREQVDAIVRSQSTAAGGAFDRGREQGYAEGWEDGYERGQFDAKKPKADR